MPDNAVKLDIIPGMSAHGWPLKTMGDALVSRQNTDWVVQGAETVRFTVTKNKKTLAQ